MNILPRLPVSDLNDLIKLERLGEGTYGTVFKVRNKKNGELSALKQIKLQVDEAEEGLPSCAVREISFLRSLDHQNIVKLKEIIPTDGKLYLLFELMTQDLRQYIHKEVGEGGRIDPLVIQKYALQILQGLNYCHKRRLLHRDLKPQNVLVNETGDIKLCDFGLAQLSAASSRVSTFQISTLWYRAPELLLELGEYGRSIDIWSLGCILAEMTKGTPVFQGTCSIEQLMLIFRVLGTPRESTWPGVSQSQIYQELSYSVELESSLEQELPGAEPALLDLLSKLFIIYPKCRISGESALCHPYFSTVLQY